jgi:uncharacterized protein (DUF952 family)
MTGGAVREPVIYKIVAEPVWRAAGDMFSSAGADIVDGFINFSTAAQVGETAARHFAGQADLLLVAVDIAILGEALKWEVSRGGDLFPHLYGALARSDVLWAKPLPLRADGRHDFSGLLS